ncbi:hypothetical protein RCL1_004904 [Eukaryota sp. TZLM3-RCL]
MVLSISVGSWNTHVAVLRRNADPELLQSQDSSNKFIPTFLSFGRSGTTSGFHSKSKLDAKIDPQNLFVDNTFYLLPRLLSPTNLDSVRILLSFTKIPYQLTLASEIRYTISRTNQSLSAEDLFSTFLADCRPKIESCYGKALDNVIFTCPSWFSPLQLQSFKNSIVAANFPSSPTVVSEPVALACACLKYFNHSDLGKVLFLDFGATSFNLYLIDFKSSYVSILNQSFHQEISGLGIDWIILENLVSKFCKHDKFSFFNVYDTSFRRHVVQLLTAIENAKIALSHAGNNLPIKVKSFLSAEVKGKPRHFDFDQSLSISEFNDLIKPVVRNCLTAVNDFINSSLIDYSMIDHVILTGGSSSLSLFVDEVRELFGPKVLNFPRKITPTSITSLGATLYQSKVADLVMSGNLFISFPQLSTQFSFIPINHTIPCTVRRDYNIDCHHLTSLDVVLSCGNQVTQQQVCKFTITNLVNVPSAPVLIRVVVSINELGGVEILARDKRNAASQVSCVSESPLPFSITLL